MNNAKTICFYNSTTAWGGGEKWHLETAIAFAKRGWRVYLCCNPKGALYTRAKSTLLPGLILHPFAVTRLSFLNPLQQIHHSKFLQKNMVQAVIMNMPADLKIIAPAAKRANVPNIFYRRGSAIAVANSWLNRRLFGMLHGVIANSEETKRLLLVNNHTLIAEKRIHLIPNGVDTHAFLAAQDVVTPAQTANFIHTHIPIEQQQTRPFILGNAGRLNRQKGQEYLIYLVRILQDAGENVVVVVAGEGERLQELKSLASTMQVAHRVIFIGFQHDLHIFWKSIDAFVLTSLWEGFGYVLLEAMLAQKPLFAFRVSNIPELVQEGKNGYLFPLPEPTEQFPQSALTDMAQAIAALIHNPGLGKPLGENGQTFALQQFTHEAMVDRVEQLFSATL